MALARGEMEVELGSKIRKLRFGIQEVSEWESLLGSDVKSHFLGNKGMTNFVRHGLYAGLLNTQRGITQPQVDEWFQGFLDNGGDEDELGLDLFEAYARGKGKAGEDLIKVAGRLREIRASKRALPSEDERPTKPEPTTVVALPAPAKAG